jgi:hypothetical protein
MRSGSFVRGFVLLALAAGCGGRSDLAPNLLLAVDSGLDAHRACVATCDGRACGASDGCGGTCGAGMCPAGEACVDGACACSAASCPTGCCSADGCVPEASPVACGTGGNACVVCPPAEACRGGACGGQLAVLFGGVDGHGHPLGDTWTWDGVAWRELPASGPSPRSGASMASFQGKVVLFGGHARQELPWPTDLWSCDGRSWSQLAVHSTPALPQRFGGGMAPLGDRLVLAGGCEMIYGQGLNCLAVTWTWDGTLWTELPSYPSVVAGALNFSALAPLGGQLVMVSGLSEGTHSPYVGGWTWDGTRWAATADARQPYDRYGAVMAPLDGKLVLFGGRGDTGVDGVHNQGALAETWTFDGTSWTHLRIPGPPGRAFAVMTPVNGALVLFGGERGHGESPGGKALSDTWTWDGASWTEQHVVGPPARSGAVMATP